MEGLGGCRKSPAFPQEVGEHARLNHRGRDGLFTPGNSLKTFTQQPLILTGPLCWQDADRVHGAICPVQADSKRGAEGPRPKLISTQTTFLNTSNRAAEPPSNLINIGGQKRCFAVRNKEKRTPPFQRALPFHGRNEKTQECRILQPSRNDISDVILTSVELEVRLQTRPTVLSSTFNMSPQGSWSGEDQSATPRAWKGFGGRHVCAQSASLTNQNAPSAKETLKPKLLRI